MSYVQIDQQMISILHEERHVSILHTLFLYLFSFLSIQTKKSDDAHFKLFDIIIFYIIACSVFFFFCMT